MNTKKMIKEPAFSKTGISVILPVYNGSKYLIESIDSILNQSYSNFELIIINDGSTDDSLTIINKYAEDERVQIYTQENQGLSATLNFGISIAKYDLIARQDQDDISMPDRLLIQQQFLEKNKDVGMVGSWAKITNEDGSLANRELKHPLTNSQIKTFLIFDNPFIHSTVIFRKEILTRHSINYSIDKEIQPPEDYELWTRMALVCKFENLPLKLLNYREVPKSMSRGPNPKFLNNIIMIGTNFTENITQDHCSHLDLHRLYHSPKNGKINSSIIQHIMNYSRIWKKINNKVIFNPFEQIAKLHLKIILKNYLKSLRLK